MYRSRACETELGNADRTVEVIAGRAELRTEICRRAAGNAPAVDRQRIEAAGFVQNDGPAGGIVGPGAPVSEGLLRRAHGGLKHDKLEIAGGQRGAASL